MLKKLILILIIIVAVIITYFIITYRDKQHVLTAISTVAPMTKPEQNIITDKDIDPDGYDDQSFY